EAAGRAAAEGKRDREEPGASVQAEKARVGAERARAEGRARVQAKNAKAEVELLGELEASTVPDLLPETVSAAQSNDKCSILLLGAADTSAFDREVHRIHDEIQRSRH